MEVRQRVDEILWLFGFWLQHPELLNILQQPHNDEEDGERKTESSDI